MSTELAPRPASDRAAAALEPDGAGTGLGPPETRGRTDIADRVLERIATRAVTEAEHAGGLSRRLLPGVPLPGTAGTRPRTTARADGQLVTVQLEISVVYPASVRQVTRELRELISNRISALTGLEVRQVDINVARLEYQPAEQPRVR